MNNISILSIGISLSLACISVAASNYVFFEQQPLARISDKGEFSAFELGEYDDSDERYVIDQQFASQIKTLWSYPALGKPEKVEVTVKEGYSGCEKDLMVVSEYGDDDGLLSLKRLPIKSMALPKKTVRLLTSQGTKMLSSALHGRNLPPKWIARVVENSTVTPVAIFPSKDMSLVVTANDEFDHQTVRVFLVATPDKQGRYVLATEEVQTGSASDSDGFTGISELALHADFNGDGIEELLILDTAYESFGARLLQWNRKEWQEVAGNGGGC